MCVWTRSWVHHETRKQKKTRNESVRKEKKRNKNQKASSCRIDRLSYVAKNKSEEKTQNVHTPRQGFEPPISNSVAGMITTRPHVHYPSSVVRFFTYWYCCSERSSRYCCRYPRSILFPLRFSLSSIFPFVCSLVHFPFFVFFPLPFLGFRFIFLSCVSCSWFSFSLVFQPLSFSFVSFSLFLLLSFCVCLLPPGRGTISYHFWYNFLSLVFCCILFCILLYFGKFRKYAVFCRILKV